MQGIVAYYNLVATYSYTPCIYSYTSGLLAILKQYYKEAKLE
jgi:hypothetical protein